MILWTPVIRKMCTLAELKTVYGYDDLCDMHEAIGLQDAIAELRRQDHEAQSKRQR
jgi:hypothetical protein